MSEKLESNSSQASSQASYHLKQLSSIVSEWPKDMDLLREENKLINKNYKQLEEKYNILLNNYENLEQKYKELENNIVIKREIECQTDLNDLNNTCIDENDDHLFNEKTFIGSYRKSDVLCNDSSEECFDDLFDAKTNTISVDEIPDSLDNSIRDICDFQDNDCLIISEKTSNGSLDEIPDSLTNSPINSPKSPVNELSFNHKLTNNAIKVKQEKYDTNIHHKSHENKFDFNNKFNSNCNAVKVKQEKSDKCIDKKNTVCIKEEKCEAIDGNNKIISVKKEKRDTSFAFLNGINVENEKKKEMNDKMNVRNSKKGTIGMTSPVKLVIKTLGPSVRKKDERKKLNGYTCKECEDYYKTRDLTEDELKARLKDCSRHRAKWSPVRSPEHFWETDFPSTPECIKRGILLIDDKPSPNVTDRRNKKSKQTKLNFNQI